MTTEPEKLRKGSRLRFIEKYPIAWGCPLENAKLLKLGNCYIVERIEVHSWHTKVFLKNYPGKDFNSAWFKVVRRGES
jgi:hypothetical protein